MGRDGPFLLQTPMESESLLQRPLTGAVLTFKGPRVTPAGP